MCWLTDRSSPKCGSFGGLVFEPLFLEDHGGQLNVFGAIATDAGWSRCGTQVITWPVTSHAVLVMVSQVSEDQVAKSTSYYPTLRVLALHFNLNKNVSQKEGLF